MKNNNQIILETLNYKFSTIENERFIVTFSNMVGIKSRELYKDIIVKDSKKVTTEIVSHEELINYIDKREEKISKSLTRFVKPSVDRLNKPTHLK